MLHNLQEQPVVWGFDEELLGSEWLGLDLEADGLFRHSEKICLVQITNGLRGVLVDPLEEDLAGLGARLLARPVWMHGADYDMALMKRAWGGVPIEVLDTQIGSRLIGSRKFGYANLVEEFFGVVLSKGSQKADWGRRPLPAQMVQYALNDVKYLIPLAEKILARLEELGRTSWFYESCAWERERALDRSENRDESWRIKGSGKLEPKVLAYLKAIWSWREVEASKWDRPSFMVAGNRELLDWSVQAAEGQSLRFPRVMRPDRRRRLLDAIERTSALLPDAWPEKVRGPRRIRDREREKVVEHLIAKREKVAASLNLEPAVLGSRTGLEAYVAGDSSKLMAWQKEVLELSKV